MNLNPRAFEWNNYALSIMGLLLITLILRLNLVPQLPHCLSFLSCPPWYTAVIRIPSALLFAIGGLAGLKASQSFGGRRNFTGRSLFYFSLFMFFVWLGPIYVPLFYLDTLPNPWSSIFSYNVLLPYSGIDVWEESLAYGLVAYALVVSLRSVWDGYDWKSWLIILLSLASGVFLGWFNFAYGDAAIGFTTLPDAMLNVWIVPFLIFVSFAACGLLWRSLGRWYVARTIRALTATYIFLILIPSFFIWGVLFTWLAGFGTTNSASSINLDVPFYYGTIMGLVAQALFCLILTQVKPRTTGPYF